MPFSGFSAAENVFSAIFCRGKSNFRDFLLRKFAEIHKLIHNCKSAIMAILVLQIVIKNDYAVAALS